MGGVLLVIGAIVLLIGRLFMFRDSTGAGPGCMTVLVLLIIGAFILVALASLSASL